MQKEKTENMRNMISIKSLGKFKDIAPIFIILIVMLVINSVLQKNFFSYSNFELLARQMAPYILVAIAQTVMMILGGLNMALGATLSFASAMFAVSLDQSNMALNLFALLGVLCMFMALSGTTGLVINAFKLPAVVVSFAFSYVWKGLALMVLPKPGGYIVQPITSFLTGSVGFIPVPLLVVAAACVIWDLIRRSSWGMLIFATGENAAGAYASGMPVWKAYLIGYAFSGLMIALAALMLCAITTSGDPTIGEPYTVRAVTAAVMGGVSFAGGRGKVTGAVIGGIVVGMLVNVIFYLKISGYFQYICEGAILILSVAFNYIQTRRKTA